MTERAMKSQGWLVSPEWPDLAFFKHLLSNSLLMGKSFQSNVQNFPHPWLHIVARTKTF